MTTQPDPDVAELLGSLHPVCDFGTFAADQKPCGGPADFSMNIHECRPGMDHSRLLCLRHLDGLIRLLRHGISVHGCAHCTRCGHEAAFVTGFIWNITPIGGQS